MDRIFCFGTDPYRGDTRSEFPAALRSSHTVD